MLLPSTLPHMKKTFEHNGITFEIRLTASDNLFTVATYLNDTQVSPAYSASLEVDRDYFDNYRKHIYESLLKIAESDIRNGIYVGNLSTTPAESGAQANE
jgi:hypothetical protein